MQRIPALIIGIILSLSACAGLPPVKSGESHGEYLKRIGFNGAVLISKGKTTLLSRGFGVADKTTGEMNRPNTKFRIGSLTKPFTALAIMMMQERELLNINKPISEYIMDYPEGDRITLRQLLTHTSGIPSYTRFDNYRQIKFTTVRPSQLVDLFKDSELEFRPGRRYAYSNSGYALLGLVLETVSGMSYGETMEKMVFTPLGMNDTEYGYNMLDKENRAVGYVEGYFIADYTDKSAAYAAGGISSTILDLQKWDQSFYDNSLISENTISEMFTPELEGYGLGWHISKLKGRLYQYHGGSIDGFRSFLARFPDERILIVVLSNIQDCPAKELAENLAVDVLRK